MNRNSPPRRAEIESPQKTADLVSCASLVGCQRLTDGLFNTFAKGKNALGPAQDEASQSLWALRRVFEALASRLDRR